MTLLSRLRTSIESFETHALHRHGVRAFRALLGVTLLFRVLTEFRYAGLLWGPHGFGNGTSTFAFGSTVGGIIDQIFEQPFGPHLLLCVQAIAAICLICGYCERFCGVVAWFTLFTLGNRLPELQDGGDNVATLALLFSTMLLPHRVQQHGRLTTWIHNVGVAVLIFQICLLYFTAGTMKIGGGVWRDGTALYYISSTRWFSHPTALEMFKHAIPSMLAAYATMLHQLWFPIAVFTRLRLPWLLFGVMFHIGIAVFMGLITFSMFMVALELLIISDVHYERFAAFRSACVSRVVDSYRARRMTTG